MKTRKCFVANSSSSSFICDVCGSTESGMDCSLSDFDMSECLNGHTICNGHKLEVEPSEPLYDEDGDLIEVEDEAYDMPICFCPICQFKELTDANFISYLGKQGITKKGVLAEIKEKFKTYNEFVDFLSEEK